MNTIVSTDAPRVATNGGVDASAGADADADADATATATATVDTGRDARVVVVEDDAELAGLYADWLAEWYDVETAADGDEALAVIDEEVDVVLLDRRMPGRSGDEVLEELRLRGLDCRVAMVTAVAPDVDLIDVPFDDYLQKPVSAGDLRRTVETLRSISDYADVQQELSSKRVRRSVLAGELTRAELADSEAVTRLDREIEALERRVDAIEADLPSYEPVLERIARSPGVVPG